MRCSMQWIVGVALAVNLMAGGMVFAQTMPGGGSVPGKAGTAVEQGKTGMGAVPGKAALVNINTADETKLTSLKGIEPLRGRLPSAEGRHSSMGRLAQEAYMYPQEIRSDMLRYPSQDGTQINAYCSRPVAAGRYPGVVVIMEAFGLIEHIKDVARRFAEQGYLAIAPDMYTREGSPDPTVLACRSGRSHWTTTALLSSRVPPHCLAALPDLERLYPPCEETPHDS